MIDTLKLADRLIAAQMPEAQAKAFAESLNEALKESTVTKEDLAVSVAQLRTDLARLKTEMLVWIVGTVGLGVLLNHFWK